MKTKTYLLLSLLLLAGCFKIPFDKQIRDRAEGGNTSNLQKIQFYINTRIELEYTTSTQDNTITAGKVTFKEGNYHYYKYFLAGTPCVATDITPNSIVVRFAGDNSNQLKFVYDPGRNAYQLDWIPIEYKVLFEGKYYKLNAGADCILTVKNKFKSKTQTNYQRIKGAKVGN